MGTILSVAAGIVLGFGLITAALYVLARALLLRLARNLHGITGLSIPLPPARISLHRAMDALSWRDRAWVDAQAGELARRGFARAGDFTIVPMPEVRVRGMVDVARGVLAALVEHEHAGRWIDLVRLDGDGRRVVATSAPPTGLLDPPWKSTVRSLDADAAELDDLLRSHADEHERARADRGGPPEVVIGRFADIFEQAYARDMDWVLERGGPTVEEIGAAARMSGAPADEEAVLALRRMWASHAEEHRERLLRQQLLETTEMSAAEWARVEDRLIFVHDELGLDDLDELIVDALDWHDEPACEALCERASTRRGASAGRAAFEAMNETLPEACRFRRITRLDDPLPADVYVAPDPKRLPAAVTAA